MHLIPYYLFKYSNSYLCFSIKSWYFSFYVSGIHTVKSSILFVCSQLFWLPRIFCVVMNFSNFHIVYLVKNQFFLIQNYLLPSLIQIMNFWIVLYHFFTITYFEFIVFICIKVGLRVSVCLSVYWNILPLVSIFLYMFICACES